MSDKNSSLERWAVVGVKDDTGSGRASRDLTRLLFPARHLVTPSYRLEGQIVGEKDVFLADDADAEQIDCALKGIEVLVVMEDQPIHHRIIGAAKNRGIKVHFVCLWEWFSSYHPIRKLYDKIICPNRLCESIIRKFGFRNIVRLNWPIDVAHLPERFIAGPAKKFVHNAGKFEVEDRKSTLLALDAFQRVKNPNVSLLVRSQNPIPYRIEDHRIQYFVGNLPDYRDLYREGDVLIQASKAEGVGLSILEGIACGLPVLTTNYPPMNEYIRDSRALVPTHWGKKAAHQSVYISQAHLKIPRVDHLARRVDWCAKNDMTSLSLRNRKWALQNFDPDRLRTQWIQALGS
jgi:glycosyltransferase involved in cell wall biosynthesis